MSSSLNMMCMYVCVCIFCVMYGTLYCMYEYDMPLLPHVYIGMYIYMCVYINCV